MCGEPLSARTVPIFASPDAARYTIREQVRSAATAIAPALSNASALDFGRAKLRRPDSSIYREPRHGPAAFVFAARRVAVYDVEA